MYQSQSLTVTPGPQSTDHGKIFPNKPEVGQYVIYLSALQSSTQAHCHFFTN